MLPTSTGFGSIFTDLIAGGVVSKTTVLVIVVDLPALSVDTTAIVFVPWANVRTLLKDPSSPTVTCSAAPLLSLTVTLHGLDVISFVVPATVQEALFVIRPSTGEEIDNTGGTVSTLNTTVF